MTFGKKFDVVLMNPPYGIKGDTIANKFLNKIIELSNGIVSVQPSAFITKFKDKRHVKEEELSLDNFNKFYTEIEIFDKSLFDASIQQELSIIYVSRLKKHNITVTNKFGTSTYNDSKKINKYNNNQQIKEFYTKIQDILNKNGSLTNHIIWTDNRDKKSLEIKENDEHSNLYYITIAYIRGHIGTDDMVTFIPKDIVPKTTGRGRTYINVKDKNECQNLINYLKTDFARMCLWFIKNDTALAYNTKTTPWFDFSDPVFSKSPKEIDDYLFKKYNVSNEIRQHIEEILPDYYNIR